MQTLIVAFVFLVYWKVKISKIYFAEGFTKAKDTITTTKHQRYINKLIIATRSEIAIINEFSILLSSVLMGRVELRLAFACRIDKVMTHDLLLPSVKNQQFDSMLLF